MLVHRLLLRPAAARSVARAWTSSQLRCFAVSPRLLSAEPASKPEEPAVAAASRRGDEGASPPPSARGVSWPAGVPLHRRSAARLAAPGLAAWPSLERPSNNKPPLLPWLPAPPLIPAARFVGHLFLAARERHGCDRILQHPARAAQGRGCVGGSTARQLRSGVASTKRCRHQALPPRPLPAPLPPRHHCSGHQGGDVRQGGAGRAVVAGGRVGRARHVGRPAGAVLPAVLWVHHVPRHLPQRDGQDGQGAGPVR
jgi:hypothetical protein